jgi:hypothetical protein
MRSTTEPATHAQRPLTVRTLVAVALGVAAALAALTFGGLAAASGRTGATADAIPLTLAVLTMAAVGTLLSVRVPSNAVGWLVLVSAVLLGVEFLALDYAQASTEFADGSWPGTSVAFWLYGNLLALPVLIMVIGIPLTFPDGRVPSPRWRWAVAMVVLVGVGEVVNWFRVGPIADTGVENPFGIAGIEPLVALFGLPPLQVAGPLAFGCGIGSVVIRYRRGTAIERAQLKWLSAATVMAVTAWAVVAVAGALGASTLLSIGWIAGLLAFSALPMAIGIAVLRYRLYEIDRIISRTIGWALVTGLLVLVFTGGVVALQAALTGLTQGNTIAVALSTLAVAALFQPVRRRVQHGVDGRFDRARYDGQRTAEAFAERLRDEVALDTVIADLHETVVASVRPASFRLWLRPARSRARLVPGLSHDVALDS